MNRFLLTILSVMLISFVASSQEEIKLYPNGAPDSNGLTVKEHYRDPQFLMDISHPRMYVYPAPADKANGTAVLICPGGGYIGVSIIKEGKEIAEWFNNLGVTAFVLFYRMPNGHYQVPLEDGRTALDIIHKRAKEWHIDKHKIGIVGFSAGGHLAATLGTHVKKNSERPAFMVLGYPVMSMRKEFTHPGSRKYFLGDHPSQKMVDLYSNELHVTKQTPPTFIVLAKDDPAVPIGGSEQFIAAMKKLHRPCELKEYEKGGHGFGMRKRGIPADNWDKLLKAWLIKEKFIK